jgi:uncharacterized protein (DUF58 family)
MGPDGSSVHDAAGPGRHARGLALTPLGWGTLAAVIASYAGAVALGYPELAVLATGGALAILAGLAWTLPVPRLLVRREIAPSRVARGDPAIGVVTVVNTGRRVRSGMRATDICGDRTVVVDVPRLPAGGHRTVNYRIPTGRRGEIPVGPLRLTRADPLGLARRVQDYGEPETLIVHPRTQRLPMLPSGRSHHLEGPTSDTAQRGTVTFHALREYVLGDDLRHIHWRSTARTGALMVRQLVDASLPRTLIVLDIRPEVYGDAGPGRAPDQAENAHFELAVDTAASVAVAAGLHSFPVKVITTAGPMLETKGGRGDTAALLDRFAVVTLSAGGTLAGALDTARRARTGGSLVLVTGAADPDELGAVASVRRRFERVVLIRAGVGPDAPGAPAGVDVIDAAGPEDLTAGWRREARARREAGAP